MKNGKIGEGKERTVRSGEIGKGSAPSDGRYK
jgi:hypothetical protein